VLNMRHFSSSGTSVVQRGFSVALGAALVLALLPGSATAAPSSASVETTGATQTAAPLSTVASPTVSPLTFSLPDASPGLYVPPNPGPATVADFDAAYAAAQKTNDEIDPILVIASDIEYVDWADQLPVVLAYFSPASGFDPTMLTPAELGEVVNLLNAFANPTFNIPIGGYGNYLDHLDMTWITRAIDRAAEIDRPWILIRLAQAVTLPQELLEYAASKGISLQVDFPCPVDCICEWAIPLGSLPAGYTLKDIDLGVTLQKASESDIEVTGLKDPTKAYVVQLAEEGALPPGTTLYFGQLYKGAPSSNPQIFSPGSLPVFMWDGNTLIDQHQTAVIDGSGIRPFEVSQGGIYVLGELLPAVKKILPPTGDTLRLTTPLLLMLGVAIAALSLRRHRLPMGR